MDCDRTLAVMEAVVNLRTFRPDPVPGAVQAKLLEALRLGPSTANTQPWELVAVQAPEVREKLVEATLTPLMRRVPGGGQPWITAAPLLWLVAIDRKRAEARVGPQGFLHAAEDCFAAIQNLRVVAGSVGLATAVVREIEPQAIAHAFGLPWWVEPLCAVAAGFPDAVPELPPRLAVGEFVHKERW